MKLRTALPGLLAFAAIGLAQDNAFLLRNVTVHPVTSADVSAASLLVRDGVIAEIGAAKTKPPKGMLVIDGAGLHVYPGMIDSATSLGLTEIGAVRETSDISELGDFEPQLRALIAVNPSSEHIPVARANGVTAAVTLPGGGVIAGQGALIRLDGWTWEEMALQAPAAMMLRFPILTMSAGEPPERPRRIPYAEAKKKHEETLEKLRVFFEDARRYQKSKAATPGLPVDRRFEAMLPVLDGKLPVIVRANRERAIQEALEFAAREKIRMILAEPREFGAALATVKARGIPVILGPTHTLPVEEDAAYDSQYSLPGELHRQGIPFAFGTFDSADVRNLPYQAAAAVPFGLPREEAFKAVTINAARIWGVDGKLGSIEVGKSADFILTDGDPLETRTQVRKVFIRGREASVETRHTRLYEKYLNRP
ncbi:MAG: amidohydrolase family protein [Bryobacteraceae bacterium]